MMDAAVLRGACAVLAALSSGAAGAFATEALQERRRRMVLRREALAAGGLVGRTTVFAAEGVWARILGYLERLSRRLALGATTPLGGEACRFSSNWFSRVQEKAGLKGIVSAQAYAEGRIRLGLALLGAGLVVGSVFSWELMLLLGAGGLVTGVFLPRLAVKQQSARRVEQLERELPEMLEVVALGLRSGLSFDRSFALYAQHFNTSFSDACANAQSSWSFGLSTREASLRALAGTYDSRQFNHVVETIVRALRFGSSLERELEQSAAEARAVRRAHREEMAAKAPVKMMIPTGTLILPAMLLMVLGPILLEMMNGF